MSKKRYYKVRSIREAVFKKAKFCPTCHFDSHSNSSSSKCPFNERYVGPEKMKCNSCMGTDHCNKRSHLCKYYKNTRHLTSSNNKDKNTV